LKLVQLFPGGSKWARKKERGNEKIVQVFPVREQIRLGKKKETTKKI